MSLDLSLFGRNTASRWLCPHRVLHLSSGHGENHRNIARQCGGDRSFLIFIEPRFECRAIPISTCQVSPPSPGRLKYLLGSIKGCRLARSNACSASGDMPSVLITLPMDMKNLRSGSAIIHAVVAGQAMRIHTQMLLLIPACIVPTFSKLRSVRHRIS